MQPEAEVFKLLVCLFERWAEEVNLRGGLFVSYSDSITLVLVIGLSVSLV